MKIASVQRACDERLGLLGANALLTSEGATEQHIEIASGVGVFAYGVRGKADQLAGLLTAKAMSFAAKTAGVDAISVRVHSLLQEMDLDRAITSDSRAISYEARARLTLYTLPDAEAAASTPLQLAS